MRYTQAQLLSLSGMSVERLRHWRKAIPSLDAGASRGGALSFEEVVLVAALSHAVDLLGVALDAFAPHYDAILAAIRNCPDDRRTRLALWMDGRTVVVKNASDPPAGDALVLVRLNGTTRKLLDGVRGTGSGQLSFILDDGPGPPRG
jgi:hypothetical protein